MHATYEDFLAMHLDAYFSLLEEFTWEGIRHDIYKHMERCIAKFMMERTSQPLPYSLEGRENFQLSHFSSRAQVHEGEGIISYFVLYFFSLFE